MAEMRDAYKAAISRLRFKNEELEKLLEDLPGPPDIRPVLEEILSAAQNIHAGWLLMPAGRITCKELSLKLDSNQPGWEDLAFKLKLRHDVIQDIRKNFSFNEGPTHTAIWIYAQKDEATVGSIFTILYELKRYDLILCSKDLIVGENGLISMVLEELCLEGIDLDSGYFSLSDEDSTISRLIGMLHRKPDLPALPNKYREFNSLRVCLASQNCKNTVQSQVLSQQECSVSQESYIERPSQPHYGSVIMLTFASDGIECAERVAAILRRQRQGRPRIGVLVLDEHRGRLALNPHIFIASYFQQVNYIVPILTRGYLDTLVGFSETNDAFSACTDARYAKLIYTLMSDSYVDGGCLNTRFRCVVPEGSDVLKHPAAQTLPVLRVWLPEQDVGRLADMALDGGL